jgi:hypothetical protein
MDITVTFQNGHWVTDPNPAIVAVGTHVRWIVRATELQTRTLLWEIDFRIRAPFGPESRTLKVKTQVVDRRERDGIEEDILRRLDLEGDAAFDHRGVTPALPADHPGDYKYDLRVRDAETEKVIGEDDPWIVVVRGILRPFDWYAF